MNANAVTTANIGNAIDSEFRTGGTLLRSRGEMSISSIDAPAVDTPNVWAAGLVVVNNEAAVAGSGSLPDPGVDDADWLWFASGYFASSVSLAAVGVEARPRYIPIDSKAMRKFHESNKTIAFVFSNSSSSDNAMLVGISVRLLVLLH